MKIQGTALLRARQAGEPQSRKSLLVSPKKLKELLEARCEHGNSNAETCQQCRLSKPMSFWEGALHRMSIEDGRQIILIQDRLRILECPWHKPLRRRALKRALAVDRENFYG